MNKVFRALAISMCLVVSFVFANPAVGVNAADSVTRPAGWTEETHGKKADPNYSVVFPDDKVQRIDITINSSDYQAMESNLNTISMFSTNDPIYVPATVKFNNNTWTKVGIRYKGQSTLTTPKQAGKHKYPFRLNFDKLEDQYPEIDNQRIYGFKELIFSNCWYDPSFIRDKFTSDLFRSAGIPTPRCSFCRVYIDTGSGPIYWGLYTMYEDPSDEMLNTQFANGDGNMYKGQSATGADLTTFNQQGYEKKTNEDDNNWSDLQALVTALNAPRNNAAQWRANLESVFNVNLFLKWLAINTAITNFDTYGWVTKNHYLYQDIADNGRIVYLPWDFNLSLTTDPFGMMGMGGMGGFGGFGGNTIPASLSLSEIGNNWPLIRYLIDDPVYKNIYHYEMREAMSSCFNQSNATARMTQLHELVRPYIVGAEGEKGVYTFLTNGTTQFDQGLAELKTLVSSRHNAVNTYLSTVTISPIPVQTSTPISNPTPTPTTSTVIAGDVNGDGVFNSLDFATFRMILLGMSVNRYQFWDKASDLNGDGAQNALDFALMRMRLLGQN